MESIFSGKHCDHAGLLFKESVTRSDSFNATGPCLLTNIVTNTEERQVFWLPLSLRLHPPPFTRPRLGHKHQYMEHHIRQLHLLFSVFTEIRIFETTDISLLLKEGKTRSRCYQRHSEMSRHLKLLSLNSRKKKVKKRQSKKEKEEFRVIAISLTNK